MSAAVRSGGTACGASAAAQNGLPWTGGRTRQTAPVSGMRAYAQGRSGERQISAGAHQFAVVGRAAAGGWPQARD